MEPSKKGVAIELVVGSVATAVGVVAMLWILRHPDVGRQINMRACLVAKRTAQRYADNLQRVADNAATQYNNLRNVTT